MFNLKVIEGQSPFWGCNSLSPHSKNLDVIIDNTRPIPGIDKPGLFFLMPGKQMKVHDTKCLLSDYALLFLIKGFSYQPGKL